MTSSNSSNTAPAPTELSCRDLWVEILQGVQPQVQRGQFITWFKETMVLGQEDGTLIIGLPLPIFLNYHIEHYQGLTLEIAKKVDSKIDKIAYKVDGGLKDDPDRSVDLLSLFPEQKKRKLPNKQEVKMAEGIISKIISPKYSLENFVVGSNSRLAHAACQAVGNHPGGKYNPLFLYGGVGLGKTHLLQATGNEILKKNPTAVVVYTTAEDFTNEVVEAIRTQKMDQLRKRYRRVDTLIIDDVQFLANKERTQEEFFHTFNTLYEEQKQVIISSDRPPQELDLEARLTSRFERGMIADISVPDYETRLAILVDKAKEYELFIDMHVLQFIADHASQNVRQLEGILMGAVAQYELEERMPTIKSIAELIQKLGKDVFFEEEDVGFEPRDNRAVSMEDIMEATSRYYSISIDDMVGQSRIKEILMTRQVAMYLGKKHARMSLVRLGKQFSGRDHTTVMNALKKVEVRMYNDSQLLREVHAIEKELGVVNG